MPLKTIAHPTISEAGLKIMRLLIGHPPQTMTDLIASLNVTRTAITEQLDELISIGLIEQKQEHDGGRGRPRYLFSATEASQRKLFEGLHSIVVPVIWRSIRDRCGNDIFNQICQDVAEAISSSYLRQLTSTTLKERVQEFVCFQKEQDRLIDFRKNEDSIDLLKFYCPFITMADEFRVSCKIDQLSMQQIAGKDASVKLIESRHDGYPCCVFRFQTNAECGNEVTSDCEASTELTSTPL